MSANKFSSLFISVQKYEGICPAAKPLHFLFTLSQSLFQYNTMPTSSMYIQYAQCDLQWSLLKPYKGLITCNTMGQYHGLQQTMCPNHVPKPCAITNHVPKPCARPNHVLDLTTFDSIPSQG